MQEFTKTESLILEALKDGPKTGFELEQLVDENKEFSKDYMSVMISNINKRSGRKIIVGKNIAGEYRYILIEESIEYRFLENLKSVLDEIETIKTILCDSYLHKSNFVISKKSTIIVEILVLLLGLAAGFYVGDIVVKPSLASFSKCTN